MLDFVISPTTKLLPLAGVSLSVNVNVMDDASSYWPLEMAFEPSEAVIATVGALTSELTEKTLDAALGFPAASVKPSATAPSKPVKSCGAPTWTDIVFPSLARQINLKFVESVVTNCAVPVAGGTQFVAVISDTVKADPAPGASDNAKLKVSVDASLLLPEDTVAPDWSDAVIVIVGAAVSEFTVNVLGDDATLLLPAASLNLLTATPAVTALPLDGCTPMYNLSQTQKLSSHKCLIFVISPTTKLLPLAGVSLSVNVNVMDVASL